MSYWHICRVTSRSLVFVPTLVYNSQQHKPAESMHPPTVVNSLKLDAGVVAIYRTYISCEFGID